MTRKLQSIIVTVLAIASVLSFGFLSSTSSGIALLAGTLLVMGGNSNPNGLTMQYELSGCPLSDCSTWDPGYISGEPGTEYAGYNFQIVKWTAQTPFTTGSNGMLYDDSQKEGVQRLEEALDAFYSPGNKVVVVGYSGSANVDTKELRILQAAREADPSSVPSPDDLSFVMFGNPNRPNGGLFSRFSGFKLPSPIGISFDGATPATDYKVTDISWKWDPASDFPNYPLNPIALLNTAIGFFTLHSVYYNADPTDPDQIVGDVTVGNTRYITLEPDHLPLLKPLMLLGIPQPVIDLLRPPLEYLVEQGYDRTVGPGTPTGISWLPPLRDPIKQWAGFFDAVGDGIAAFNADLSKKSSSTATTEVSTFSEGAPESASAPDTNSLRAVSSSEPSGSSGEPSGSSSEPSGGNEVSGTTVSADDPGAPTTGSTTTTAATTGGSTTTTDPGDSKSGGDAESSSSSAGAGTSTGTATVPRGKRGHVGPKKSSGSSSSSSAGTSSDSGSSGSADSGDSSGKAA